MEINFICFSHLRWDFVYQRPQHLLSRFANYYRVFYIEEPVFLAAQDGYTINYTKEKVNVIKLSLSGKNDASDIVYRINKIIRAAFADNFIEKYFFWYYTPLALAYTDNFQPDIVVYDCMDELSAFKFASSALKQLEEKLFQKADIVFTGGHSLFNAKKHLHKNIYAFPSSIDKEHFIKARFIKEDNEEQRNIPHPRFGFFGVIDERFDIELLRSAALQKPQWHFILAGPVVKINPDDLPKLSNIHYTGSKSYNELPEYISGWDVALIPFALNEATKFISPTKTPEYLAAGKPVISTAIEDVVHPYGKSGLVKIIRSAAEFIAVAEDLLNSTDDEKQLWLKKTDEFLKTISWNETWHQMNELIKKLLQEKEINSTSKMKTHV